MPKNLEIKELCDDFVNKIIIDFFLFLQKEKKYSSNTISSYQDDIANFIYFIYKATNKIIDKNFLEKLVVADFRSVKTPNFFGTLVIVNRRTLI